MHLWDIPEDNFLDIYDIFDICYDSWQSFLEHWQLEEVQLFRGCLLTYFWWTPSNPSICRDCTDEAFCENCFEDWAGREPERRPYELNQLALAFSNEPGGARHIGIVLIDVRREQEDEIRTWLRARYLSQEYLSALGLFANVD